MDDIYLPDEEQINMPFTRKEIKPEEVKKEGTTGINASSYVKITFDRFVTLVANHSFIEVVEKNKNEEVIISTNLLTDLANARGISPRKMGPFLFAGGLLLGGIIVKFLV
ncbi:MAG: hypothetical protein AAB836_01035 [Patescibacteria group bacterium]